MADPAGVPSVNLLLQLLAGEDCLCAVNDDHMIAAVAVGSECRLVLASQNVSGCCSYTAQGLVCCVENIPAALNFGSLRHIS